MTFPSFWRSSLVISAGLAALLAVACSGSDVSNGDTNPDPTDPTPTDPVGDDLEGSDWTFDGDEATAKPSSDAPVGTGGSTGYADAGADSGFAGSGGASGGAAGAAGGGTGGSGGTAGGTEAGGSGGDTGGTGGSTSIPAGQLTAGEWNDLENWTFFEDLLVCPQSEPPTWCSAESTWQFEMNERFAVRVSNEGNPVRNAVVTLRDGQDAELWEARTDVTGQAELFASMFGPQPGPYTIRVVTSAGTAETTLSASQGAELIELDVDAPAPAALSLDLMFVVDTTGSMSDELSYIQAELEDVIERVHAGLSQQLTVRLSTVFYRDEGDAYVVRSFPFTTDVPTAIAALRDQSADGGGDTPEAVDRAMQVAIDQQAWNENSAAKLMFLVLDAPPHQEDAAAMDRVRALTQRAAAKGIRIVPVSASGIDKDTEFLLRFMDVATGGTYTFLTDDSGIGGSHLAARPTIGDYEVELLNDLMVRIVTERLAW